MSETKSKVKFSEIYGEEVAKIGFIRSSNLLHRKFRFLGIPIGALPLCQELLGYLRYPGQTVVSRATIADLAENLDTTRANVERYLGELEELGLIVIQKGTQGQGNNSTYDLKPLLTKLDDMARHINSGQTLTRKKKPSGFSKKAKPTPTQSAHEPAEDSPPTPALDPNAEFLRLMGLGNERAN